MGDDDKRASAPTAQLRGGRSTATDADPPLAAGEVAGDFVIEALIGAGGFGRVYRAHRAGDGRLAAIKVMRRELLATEGLVARFVQERRVLARLRHPHVVELMGAGELTDGRPYLAMAWLEGRTLWEELGARGPLSAPEAIAVAEELCAALAAVHALGLVHRDLKAENIMAVPAGDWFRCVLLDFGIVKLMDPGADTGMTRVHTSTGLVVGTPRCMAPEQIRGEPVDARTDVYALGALLYELVTGRPPFEAPTALEVEEMHLTATPPRPSDAAPVPRQYDEVVLRCLAKAPGGRFASVDEVISALRGQAPAAAV